MKKVEYEFRPGSRFQPGFKATPDVVASALNDIALAGGGDVRPEAVVADARGGNHPLHGAFEWSETAAAHQYRLEQARALIRSVIVVYKQRETPGGEERKVNLFVHIGDSKNPHYEETATALAKSDTRVLILQRAWNELQTWKRNYESLSEFAKLVDIIDALPVPAAGGTP